jgi:hypothetical protein
MSTGRATISFAVAAMLLAFGCGARARRGVVVAAPEERTEPLQEDASGPAYLCGVALLGYGCDNGRSHYAVVARTMTEAIASCRARLPAHERELCYVRNAGTPVTTDTSDCVDARASWRAGECCNFVGTLSCP